MAATASLLINDHLLKGWAPGWLTGKLSDLCWPLVAAVVLAAVLAWVPRLGPRLARGLALGSAGLVFVLLQLWPPLGDGICALVGGQHTPDPTDLLCLPALALAPLCWRPTRRRRWALPVAAAACLATSYHYDPCDGDWRYPCRNDEAWDPGAPLVIHFDRSPGGVDVWAPGFADAISLKDDRGLAQPLLLYGDPEGNVLVCPQGGLLPSARYHWQVGPFPELAHNRVGGVTYSDSGISTFLTHAAATLPPVSSLEDCDQALLERVLGDAYPSHNPCCGWEPDTGEPGGEDTGGEDTGGEDTGETGDTARDTGASR